MFRAIVVYSLPRQNIGFFFRTRIKHDACTLTIPAPEKRVLRRHERGYGNLVLWYLPTPHLTRCIHVDTALYSHASFLPKGQRVVTAVIGPKNSTWMISLTITSLNFADNTFVVIDYMAYPSSGEN